MHVVYSGVVLFELLSGSDWQVPGDPPDGGRPQQHSQVSETHRRSRAVPHIPDPPGIKGETHRHIQADRSSGG